MNLPNTNGSNKGDAAFMNMEVISGTYQFKVQYSKTKHICKVNGDHNCITSPIFKVNGHDCKILYYPPGSEDTIELTLAMHCKSEKVTASFTLGLLDKYGRPSSKACKSEKHISFASDPDIWDEHTIPDFMERSELEGHFVRDGCFTLVCSITILDEFFTAHRSILAARSPVFNAELFGPMVERKTETITIKDTEAAVFKAMLHFIYTDSLPDMLDENIPLVTMTKHLLVAADRYALDGLKMLCEGSLMMDITMDNALRRFASVSFVN